MPLLFPFGVLCLIWLPFLPPAAGSSAPSLCPSGTFSNLLGRSAVSDCQLCPSGFYCEGSGLKAPSGECWEGKPEQPVKRKDELWKLWRMLRKWCRRSLSLAEDFCLPISLMLLLYSPFPLQATTVTSSRDLSVTSPSTPACRAITAHEEHRGPPSTAAHLGHLDPARSSRVSKTVSAVHQERSAHPLGLPLQQVRILQTRTPTHALLPSATSITTELADSSASRKQGHTYCRLKKKSKITKHKEEEK